MSDENSAEPPKVTSEAPKDAGDSPKPPGVRVRKKKKGQVKQVVKKPPIILTALKHIGAFIKVHLRPLMDELFSEDAATRRMSVLLLLSVAGLIALISSVFFNCGSSKLLKIWQKSQESALENKELIHRQRERADLEAAWLLVEKFTFDLRPGPGIRKFGPTRLAVFDMSLQSDSPETRNFLEQNLPQVRNEAFKCLTGLDRETLMTVEGKKKLRQNILDAINAWLPEGKVLDLYFVKFIFK